MAGPLSFEDYKLAGSTKDGFDIAHPDGSIFKVARKGLGPDMVKSIEGMASFQESGGNPFFNLGMIKDAGQGLINAIGSSAPGSPFASLVQPQAQKGLLASNEAVGVPGLEMSPGQPSQYAPQDTIGAPQMAAKAQETPAPAPAVQGGFGLIQKGIEGSAKAAQDMGQATADAYASQMDQMKAAQENYAANRKALDAQNDKLFQEVLSEKIEPQRYLANMSTGNKIVAGIALALGGLAGGLDGSGRNQAMETLQKTIDQDIEAQRNNLNKKNTLLSQNLQRTKNLDEALTMTQSQLLAMTAAKVEQAKAMAQGPAARAQADQLLGELKLKQAALNEETAKKKMLQQVISGGQGVNPEVLRGLGDQGKDLAERQVVLPNGKQVYARNKEDVKELSDEIATINPLFEQLKELEKIGPSALSPGSPARQKAQAIRANVANLLRENQGVKRLFEGKGEEGVSVLQQFEDPTSFNRLLGDGGENKVLQNFLMKKLEGKLAAKVSNYQAPYRPKTETPFVAQR